MTAPTDQGMDGALYAEPLVLHPLTEPSARELLDANRLPHALRAGAGWPHADSLDGVRMVARGARCWLVTLDGEVIGDCGTVGAVDEQGDIEIGYGLAEPYRRRGHGTTLTQALARWLLGQPGVRRVVASVDPTNLPSYRVLERAGFARVSECDHELRYALGHRG